MKTPKRLEKAQARRRRRELSADNEIVMYMHCALCVGELKAEPIEGQSPATYARISVGWTPLGLQVWCDRHDCNIAHVDFEGHKHPANLSRRVHS